MEKSWNTTYNPKQKFSGKEREDYADIDYFGARYYYHNTYRFLSVDPVINKEEAISNPQLWNLYSYCRNNPITYLDPDGRFIRDKTGKLKFKSGPNNYIFVNHKGDRSKVNRIKWGYLIAEKNKKRIYAKKNMSKDERFDTDCHGFTFTEGEYWIDNPQVKDILEYDNWKNISKPQEGDIAVWFNEYGDVQHSGKISKIDKGQIFVTHKPGISPLRENDLIERAWNSTPKFYRKVGEN